MKNSLFVLGGVVGGVVGMVMSAAWFVAGIAFTAAVLKDKPEKTYPFGKEEK